MAKPLVERYEQILSEDPTSSVFVELAKALLAQSEWDRAIEVCRAGLEHHPQSVTARVLWGRALIHLGKPAPAMEQFDLAVGIDRDNPHAYNLISEVLLQKGLYRSALPILRKAVALQPHDARVKGWFEQTQAVLKGGPAPEFAPTEALLPREPAEDEVHGGTGADDAPSPVAPEAAGPTDGRGEQDEEQTRPGGALPSDPSRRTQVLTPSRGLQAQVLTPAGGIPRQTPPPEGGIPRLFPREDLTPPGGAPALGDASGPGDAATPREGTPAVPARRTRGGGLVSASWEVGPQDLRRPAPDASEERTQMVRIPAGADAERERTDPEAEVTAPHGNGPEAPSGDAAPGPDTERDGEDDAREDVARGDGLPDVEDGAEATDGGGGLLGELPTLEEAPRHVVHSTDGLLPEVIPESVGGGGLLAELPLPAEEPARVTLRVARPQVTSQVSAAIASEYEKELRAKLEHTKAERGARTRKIVIAAAALLVVGVLATFVWSFTQTREDFGGKDLKGALADARLLLGQDTHASITQALQTLGAATRMDPKSTEAWSLVALSHGLLAADHDGGDAARSAARDALAHEGVAVDHPGTLMVVDWLLAEGRQRELTADVVLASKGDDAEVHALAGRILLARGKSEPAFARFQQALQLVPTHGRTLLALGGYFREAGDFDQAVQMYERVDAPHPEKVIGEVEIGLQRDEPADDAQASLEALPGRELRTPELQARHLVALGRLHSLAGRHAEAEATVEKALALQVRRVATLIALSGVQRAAGHTAQAQDSAQKALALEGSSDAAREALGRALLARGKASELLTALPADPANRTVSLMRGLARTRLEEWKSARTELLRTELDGRFPPEAVVALATVDAAGGKPEKAQEVLEKILVGDRKAPDSIRVALGRVYAQLGLLAKARAQFEEAAASPRDVEGNVQLGRLLLGQDLYRDALSPLKTALARNAGDDEARAAMAQAMLGLGETAEVRTRLEAWAKDDPESARAQIWTAREALLSGDAKRAARAANQATKLDRGSAEAVRLQSLALSMQGDATAAFRALQRANKLDPKDAEIFCEIGWTFLRQGNDDNAQAAFDAALRQDAVSVCARVGQVRVDPRSRRDKEKEYARLAEDAGAVWTRADWLVALAHVQLSRGSPASARKSAEQAVALVPGLARAQEAIALAAEKQRDPDAARAAWARAVALDPANGSYKLAQADALVRERDQLEAAVEAYTDYLKLSGSDRDVKRVRKLLPTLRKRLASR